jgi:hypothetical protein
MRADNAEDGIQAIGTSDAPADVCDKTEAEDVSEAEDSEACLNREVWPWKCVTLTMRKGSTQTQRKMTSHTLLQTWLCRGGQLPERKPWSGHWRRCFLSGKQGRFARIFSLFAAKKTSRPTSLGGQRSSNMTHSKLHEEHVSTITWTKSRCAC